VGLVAWAAWVARAMSRGGAATHGTCARTARAPCRTRAR
jgi:hypothetical protein